MHDLYIVEMLSVILLSLEVEKLFVNIIQHMLKMQFW